MTLKKCHGKNAPHPVQQSGRSKRSQHAGQRAAASTAEHTGRTGQVCLLRKCALESGVCEDRARSGHRADKLSERDGSPAHRDRIRHPVGGCIDNRHRVVVAVGHINKHPRWDYRYPEGTISDSNHKTEG